MTLFQITHKLLEQGPERVGGEGKVSIAGIGEAGQFVQGDSDRHDSGKKSIQVVVLVVYHGRLPETSVLPN